MKFKNMKKCPISGKSCSTTLCEWYMAVNEECAVLTIGECLGALFVGNEMDEMDEPGN